MLIAKSVYNKSSLSMNYNSMAVRIVVLFYDHQNLTGYTIRLSKQYRYCKIVNFSLLNLMENDNRLEHELRNNPKIKVLEGIIFLNASNCKKIEFNYNFQLIEFK